MQIELRRTSEITPYDRNPRQNKVAVDAVARSIQEFGFRQPIVVDQEGVIVIGHTRWKAALKLGPDAVPVHIAKDLTPEQAKAYRLADNRTAEMAQWDYELLPIELAELKELDFDLALTGFSDDELEQLLSGPGGAEGLTDADDVPEPPDEAETQPGDLWILGNHRLLCGDATSLEDVGRLMDCEKAEVLWTDPPYGVSYVGKTRDALTIQNDGADEFRELLDAALAAADSVLNPSARFYLATPAGPRGTEFRLAIERVGWRFHQALVWAKDVFVLGHSDYHYQHEDILYGWKPGPGRPGRGKHDGTRWYGGHDQASVFHVDRPKRSTEHPTMKPPQLIAQHLANSARPTDVVLDLFAGSGSTLIAAEQTGRKAFLMELDPLYCDVIVQRYEEFAGRIAERIAGAVAA